MSQWTEFSYRYDGSYAGFLTCVFESYARRELPEQFSTAEDPRVSLWPERAVETDREKAGRVYRSLSRRISRQAQELVTQGFLTCMPDKELRLYEFLRLGYRVGPAVTSTRFPARSWGRASRRRMCWSSCSGSGSFPAPTSPQARRPEAGAMTSQP